MAALRALVGLVSFLLLVVVSLLGLGALLLAITGGSLAPDLGLPALRDAVGDFFDQIERGGARGIVIAAGVGAMLVGLLLLIGLVAPRRERLVVVDEGSAGRLAARRRALADIARSLAVRGQGVSAAKAKVKPRRRGEGGRLTIRASRPRTTPADDASQSVEQAVEPLASDFGLKTRVRAELGEGGERVQ